MVKLSQGKYIFTRKLYKPKGAWRSWMSRRRQLMRSSVQCRDEATFFASVCFILLRLFISAGVII
jgi:hypothetical protein